MKQVCGIVSKISNISRILKYCISIVSDLNFQYRPSLQSSSMYIYATLYNYYIQHLRIFTHDSSTTGAEEGSQFWGLISQKEKFSLVKNRILWRTLKIRGGFSPLAPPPFLPPMRTTIIIQRAQLQESHSQFFFIKYVCKAFRQN